MKKTIPISFDFVRSGKRTIEMERRAIEQLVTSIDDSFQKACQLILRCKGRVVVTGLGKSGHIAKKIAATLASTGTPSFYIHPSEASHGDLGMITDDDLIIAISNSGKTDELIKLIPLFKRLNTPIIALTGSKTSVLAQQADVHLDVHVDKEACPLDLAPTSSTTVTLVMGDALAVALLEARGFTPEDFALSHPGGSLGRKLLLKVNDVMLSGEAVPKVSDTTPLIQALAEMTSKSLGMTTIVDPQERLVGIFTDGDLRRCLDQGIQIDQVLVKEVMSSSPRVIDENKLAVDALNEMERYRITALVVENSECEPVGIVHMHSLLMAGIV